MTKQPKWKAIGGIGDVDPIAHGGGFVYEDSTGVYAPEMTYFEPSSDETWHKLGGRSPLTVYRVLIERDSTKEWWYSKLDSITPYTGQSLEDIQRYANGSTMERAQLYSDLISYFGAHEFDSYPEQTTEGKAYFRYWREMKKNLSNKWNEAA
jgi:hypothetical protein